MPGAKCRSLKIIAAFVGRIYTMLYLDNVPTVIYFSITRKKKAHSFQCAVLSTAVLTVSGCVAVRGMRDSSELLFVTYVSALSR